MSRFGIIGCGLTGAITASLLKQYLPHSQIIILEKSKGTGGRFGTSRSPFGSTVDIGAQYITKTTSLSDFQKKCYSELLESGLLQPLHGTVEGLKNYEGTENYLCPQGSGSIVKYYLKSVGCEILFGQKVTSILNDGDKWKLLCENNSSYEFDSIILTIPVPQVLQVKGIFSYIPGQELENMKSVEYSSRFALGLFYDHPTKYFDSIPFVSKYIYESDNILRFCSIDHKKRNSSDLPSVAVHTTTEFGKTHIEEESAVVGKQVLDSLKKILPDLPEPSFIKYHKWRYSQVEKSYPGKPGCVVLSKKPLLLGGGDGFSYSTLEGCVYSSEKILNYILKNAENKF